jgi:hypothetical protein
METRRDALTTTSVILFALPGIAGEFVRNAVSRNPDLRIAADLRAGDDLRGALDDIAGRVAVVGGMALSEEQIAAVLRSHPDARVFELVDDGRDTLLYELRPHRTRLGQVSPHSLVQWIRTPASSAVVQGAC